MAVKEKRSKSKRTPRKKFVILAQLQKQCCTAEVQKADAVDVAACLNVIPCTVSHSRRG